MKTFEVIAISGKTGQTKVIATFEADYYKEIWDFHFYKKSKHWWQSDIEIGQFPLYKNIIVREKQ